MRLLFIVPYAPTLIRTRPFSFLKQLCARGHHLTLATLWSTPSEREVLTHWKSLGVQVVAAPLPRHRSWLNALRALPTPTPLQAVFCWQPLLAHQVTQLLAQNEFDACHVEHLRGALYGRHVQRITRAYGEPLRIVWDSVDCITSLFEQASAFSRDLQSRVLTRMELKRTRAFEPAMVQTFDATTVVTEPERTALQNLIPSASVEAERVKQRVHIVPNGVDLEYFVPRAEPRDAATILFSGKMSYHANLTAALFLLDEIMPRVWQIIPEARVVIAGQNPPKSLVRRAQRERERVKVTGSVPDIRPYLARATIACAPMIYGAGVQNKILEAMAMGLPVIAAQPAAQALAVQHEHELLIGTSAAELSAQLLCALRDESLRARLAKNARDFVKTQQRWQDSAAQLEILYQPIHS